MDAGRYTRHIVAGHSYTQGVGGTSTVLVGQFDGYTDIANNQLARGFSPVETTFDGTASQVWGDTFNRTNTASTIGYNDSGFIGSWINQAGTWGIQTNAAYLSSGAGSGDNAATIDFGTTDGVIDIIWGVVANGIGVVFRYQDASNYYFVRVAPSNKVQLYKKVAGVDTQLGTDAALASVTGSHLQVGFRGSQIVINGASNASNFCTNRLTVTDTTYTTGNRHGLYAVNGILTASRWDMFTFTACSIPSTETGNVAAVQQSGYWNVTGGELALLATAGDNNIVTWECGSADGTIEVTIGANVANTFGVVWRYVDASNYMYLSLGVGSSTWTIHKVVAGVDTSLGSVLGTVAAGTNFGKIRIVVAGKRVRAYNNPDNNPGFDLEVTDAALLAGTKHGFWNSAAAAMSWGGFKYTRQLNIGRGGSQLGPNTNAGSYVYPLQYQPQGLGTADLVSHCWGINDINLGTDARAQKGWQSAMRTVVARAFAKTVYEDSDASVAYGGTWSTVNSTNNCSGTTYHSCTSATSRTVTITVPAGFASGVVQLGFVAVHDDGGGTAAITVDAVSAGTVDTNGIWNDGVAYTGHVVRLTGLAAGAHTIVVTVSTVSGTFIFDYWAEEQSAANAATVRVLNVARLPAAGYTSYSNAFHDGEVDIYNGWTASVLAEFSGMPVQLVDISSPMSKSTVNFTSSDSVHPNTVGHQAIATALYRSVYGVPVTVTGQISTSAPYATPGWTSMPYVQSFDCTQGRSSAFDGTFQPQQLNVRWQNELRQLDPANTSASLVSYLTPQRRIRLLADHPAVVSQTSLAHGWATMWGQENRGKDAVAITPCRDWLGLLADRPLLSSPYAIEVAADSPYAWYRMDETSGQYMLDSSGNQHNGYWEGNALEHSTDSLLFDPGHAVEFDGTDDAGRASISAAPFAAVEFWVSATGQTTDIFEYCDTTDYGFRLVPFTDSIGVIAGPGGIGNAAFWYPSTMVTGGGDTSLWDGNPHHVAWIHATHTWIIDGVEIASGGGGAATTVVTRRTEMAISRRLDSLLGWLPLWAGTLDELAFYTSAPSVARFQTHYTAGTTAWDADLTGARVTRILNAAGQLSADRDIDAGQRTLGQASLGGTATAYLQTIARTEQGAVYQRGDGMVRYRDRTNMLTATRSTVTQAVFTDDETDTTGYYIPVPDLEPASIDQVRNTVNATWAGGTVVTNNQTSTTAYGYTAQTIDTIARTAAEAYDIGGWVLAHNADPHTRISAVVLNTADPRLWWPALNLRIGDRVTVSRKPQNTGVRTTYTCIIDGRTIQAGNGTSYVVTLYLTPADTSRYFTIGTSACGGTDPLA